MLRQTIKQKSLHWPNGITIDLVMDRVYWIDAKLHMIGSANLDGTASRMVLFNTKVLGHPFSITVFEDKVSNNFGLMVDLKAYPNNQEGEKIN